MFDMQQDEESLLALEESRIKDSVGNPLDPLLYVMANKYIDDTDLKTYTHIIFDKLATCVREKLNVKHLTKAQICLGMSCKLDLKHKQVRTKDVSCADHAQQHWCCISTLQASPGFLWTPECM